MSGKLLSVLVVIALSAACGDASGCGDFEAQSPPLDVGESAEVVLLIVDRHWAYVDFAGHYWMIREPVPDGLPSNGNVTGVATLLQAESPGQQEVRIELGPRRAVTGQGPITCE